MFARRQDELVTVARKLAAVAVEHQRAATDERVAVGARTPQLHANPCFQLSNIERFGEIDVGAARP